MPYDHGTTRGWRHMSDIRFTDVRIAPDGVDFDAVGEGGVPIHFSISTDVLRQIADRDPRAPIAEIFEERRVLIHGVAARLFHAGVRGDPIRLQTRMFSVT